MLYNRSMILTIFGYPKSGKTLLFNLLTNKKEKVSKFSTPSNEYHKAVVEVPDRRLEQLAAFHHVPPTYARIEYLDTGALAFKESKNTTFIDLLRRAEGLVHMVRGFEDDEILHPEGEIDPLRDIRTMEDELKAVDFISVEKRVDRLTVDVKKIKSKELQEELDLMLQLKEFLEQGHPLREFPFTPQQELAVKGFKFLSSKPMIHLVNADEHTYKKYIGLKKDPENKAAIQVFCGQIEQELLELEEEDRKVFQEEYGLADYEYLRDNFINISYRLMNLISFFTVGEEETKAWTIRQGDTAYIAAGKIHTDLQTGFIRAETIDWKEFLDCNGFVTAKEKGLLRLEGKEYIVKDGEIVHIRFNK